jgi:hypothetical protein
MRATNTPLRTHNRSSHLSARFRLRCGVESAHRRSLQVKAQSAGACSQLRMQNPAERGINTTCSCRLPVRCHRCWVRWLGCGIPPTGERILHLCVAPLLFRTNTPCVAASTQDKAPTNHVVEVHVFDAVGTGAGGSGAAAGLLHPFSPNGKVRSEFGFFMTLLQQ